MLDSTALARSQICPAACPRRRHIEVMPRQQQHPTSQPVGHTNPHHAPRSPSYMPGGADVMAALMSSPRRCPTAAASCCGIDASTSKSISRSELTNLCLDGVPHIAVWAGKRKRELAKLVAHHTRRHLRGAFGIADPCPDGPCLSDP